MFKVSPQIALSHFPQHSLADLEAAEPKSPSRGVISYMVLDVSGPLRGSSLPHMGMCVLRRLPNCTRIQGHTVTKV